MCRQHEFTDTVNNAINIKRIMTDVSQPTLILHTRHDGLIDVSHAKRLAEWCSGPTELKIFPSGSHNDIMFVNAREYFEEISRFIASLQA